MRALLAAVLILFLAYGVYFIYQTSFILEGERYFVLFDDAMISMRYARNLIAGHGLVWNIGGERVEGFTSPLWTFYMAVMHLLPIPISRISAALQVSGLILLLTNLLLVRSLAQRLSGAKGAGLVAVLMTATYFPLNNWSLQGMAVSALTVWLSAGVWLVVRSFREPRFFLPLCLWSGVGTLLSTNAVILAITMLLLGSLAGEKRRHRLLLAAASVGGFLLLQTLWRVSYYGDVIPNVYTLKLSGYAFSLRWARGVASLFDFLSSMRWILCLPLLLVFYKRDRQILALSTIVLVQLLYAINLGGDSWESSGGTNRFLVVTMPLCLVLLSIFYHDVFVWVRKRLAPVQSIPQRFLRGLLWPTSVVVLLGSVLLLNFHDSLRQSVNRWALVERPLNVNENRKYVKLATQLERITTPDASVAVVSAGTVSYFFSRESVDLLGRSDRTVARGPVRVEPGTGPHPTLEPGHFKWDYTYSLGALQPDVIIEPWYGMQGHASWAAYYAYDMGMHGTVSLRTGSTNLRVAPEDVVASSLWWQGLGWEQRQDWEQAIEVFAQAIATGTYNESWRYHFGMLMVEHRPLADVEAYYSGSAEHDPKPQTSHFFRGLALAKAGRFDESVGWFRKAIEVDPAHEMSHEMWGNVLLAQSRIPEAILHYRQALRIIPEYKSARLGLADALQQLGRREEATQERSRAEAADELTDALRFYRWGQYLLKLGHVDAAIAELERACEADPDNKEMRRLLHSARQSP